MSITTLDGIVAGMQPPQDFMKTNGSTQVPARAFSPFYTQGTPGPAIAPTPGMAGAALTTYAGQLPFVNGGADQYLARFSGISPAGALFLCDRLWHNSGINVTTTGAQTVNSVAWPARDDNASTNGVGVRIGLEVSTVTGAGASVHTISYTDEGGTAGATGSPRVAYAASSIAGAFYDYSLAAGDTGVRSVESFTSTVSMTSGVVHLVAYRVLARVPVPLLNTEYAVDSLTSGLPKLHDNTVPFVLFVPAGIGAATLVGGQFIQTNG